MLISSSLPITSTTVAAGHRKAVSSDGQPQSSIGSGSAAGVDDPRGPEKAPQEDPRQQADLQQLKQTDRAVRSHEMAHVAAGGQYVTHGATFTYRKGPDGQMYAVGGEVGIDTSPVNGDPQATLLKAIAIQRAALAPADPSPQDRSVAAKAARMAARARTEIQAQNRSDGAAGGEGANAVDGYRRDASGRRTTFTFSAIA